MNQIAGKQRPNAPCGYTGKKRTARNGFRQLPFLLFNEITSRSFPCQGFISLYLKYNKKTCYKNKRFRAAEAMLSWQIITRLWHKQEKWHFSALPETFFRGHSRFFSPFFMFSTGWKTGRQKGEPAKELAGEKVSRQKNRPAKKSASERIVRQKNRSVKNLPAKESTGKKIVRQKSQPVKESSGEKPAGEKVDRQKNRPAKKSASERIVRQKNRSVKNLPAKESTGKRIVRRKSQPAKESSGKRISRQKTCR